MLVNDLIKLLEQQDQDAVVYVATECHGCFEPAGSVFFDARGMVVVDTAKRDESST